jgi:hypothetical protein
MLPMWATNSGAGVIEKLVDFERVSSGFSEVEAIKDGVRGLGWARIPAASWPIHVFWVPPSTVIKRWCLPL